jgi:hypothetical protein
MLCQHGCLYFGTQSTEEWLDCPVIHEVCIQMNLQQTGCTLPPCARNEAWITRDAHSEDNEELRFNSKCANVRNLQSAIWNWHTKVWMPESQTREMPVAQQLDEDPKTRSDMDSRVANDQDVVMSCSYKRQPVDWTIELTPAYEWASHIWDNSWIIDPMEFPLSKKCETWMLAMGTNEKHGGID